MKKEFDFLATDKEPFLYLEHCFLKKKDSNLVSVDIYGHEEIIPVALVLSLFMGPGTSITHDAARVCAENDCYISIVNGGTNVHSIWHSGRWHSPEKIVKQVKVFSSPSRKLFAAKKILKRKLINSHQEQIANHLKHATSLEELMGIEAAAAKSQYRLLAENEGFSFKRDHSSIEGVNGKISLLCNVLYHYMTIACVVYGVDPSLGFLHGSTRRGGLSFDLADVFKHELVLVPSFTSKEDNSRLLMLDLSQKLKQNRSSVLKETFEIIEEVINESGRGNRKTK